MIKCYNLTVLIMMPSQFYMVCSGNYKIACHSSGICSTETYTAKAYNLRIQLKGPLSLVLLSCRLSSSWNAFTFSDQAINQCRYSKSLPTLHHIAVGNGCRSLNFFMIQVSLASVTARPCTAQSSPEAL